MINNIVPTPKKTEIFDGMIEVPRFVSCDAEWGVCADTLAQAFDLLFGYPIARGEGISLARDESLSKNAYRLDSRDGIVLYASDAEGMYYAVASLLLAVSARDGKVSMERALIEDFPDKDYRALLVDLAREWHPAHTVHQYIELCFILKIKYLQLHFGDDQGYTLPSKAFPHLTDGYRHYSFGEIAEMREHAHLRGVEIIPEVDVPGHATILVKNCPETFANQTQEGEFMRANLICAGSDRTFAGVKTLLDELCELFPDATYLHIGGDEANIKLWNDCPVCRAYMEKNGIADERELYSEFVGRVARYVLSLGKTPIVWEGFPKNGIKHIPKECIVIVWESYYHMADELLAEGFQIVNAAWKPLYIVPNLGRRWGIPEILSWNVYTWQHFSPMSKAYLNPVIVPPTDSVLGAELCAWESTFEAEIGRTVENLLALSEKTWTVERLHEDREFIKRADPTLIRVTRYIQER